MAKPRTRKPAARAAVAEPPPTARPERDDAIEALFAAIPNEPDDWAAYVVLADALLERNDPRGELVQVQHALATTPKATHATLAERERRLIVDTRARLLGPKLAPLPTIEVGFRFGFADVLSLADLSMAQLIAVFDAIAASGDARLLRSIEISPDEDNYTAYQLRDLFAALGTHKLAPPPSVRRLRLGNAFANDPGDRTGGGEDEDEDEDANYDGELGRDDLSAVLDVFRQIEELEVDLGSARLSWAPLRSPKLRRFEWISPRIRDAELRPLATSSLPALASFVLWTGAEYGSGDPDDDRDFDGDGMGLQQTARVSMEALRAVFTMLDRHPMLRESGLPHYAGHLPRLLMQLANHPCVRRLETLDLAHRAFDDEDADAILDFLTDVSNIKRLGIDDVITTTAIQNRLARRIKCVGAWGDEPTRFRLVTTME